MNQIELSRQPRSDVEAIFIRLQEESDRAGVAIYSHSSWTLEEPHPVQQARQTFNSCLDRLKSFAPAYVGDPGAEIGLEARYLYDLDELPEKGYQRVYLPVLPIDSLFFLAAIAGRIDEVSTILGRNPLNGTVGWRVCLIVAATDVMGWHVPPKSKNRVKIAVPLGEILSLPIGREEIDQLTVEPGNELKQKSA